MLLEFSIGNYLSFRERKTLSLEPVSITDYKENCSVNGNYSGLKSIVLYGANASGKSNLIKAMSVMKKIIKTSSRISSTDEIDVVPFLLNTQTQNKPSFFEIVFIYENIKYRYGFEVDKKTIQYEWLFETLSKSEKPLFLRTPEGIDVKSNFKEGKGLEEKTRDNALFLGIADQFNGVIAKKIMTWVNNWNIISGIEHEDYSGYVMQLLTHEYTDTDFLDFLNKFVTQLDLGLDNIRLVEKSKGNATFSKLKTFHKVLNENLDLVNEVSFDIREQESAGTNKLIDFSGFLYSAIINSGIVVIDELDAKLHPIMTNAIVQLFNSQRINPDNAQLIFTTHDTNLLSNGKFRRDQIYFVEKDNYNSSDLYSLIEYREGNIKIRKDRSFEKDYVNGRYGAIPFIGNFEELMK
jgi:uncharacterized protein